MDLVTPLEELATRIPPLLQRLSAPPAGGVDTALQELQDDIAKTIDMLCRLKAGDSPQASQGSSSGDTSSTTVSLHDVVTALCRVQTDCGKLLTMHSRTSSDVRLLVEATRELLRTADDLRQRLNDYRSLACFRDYVRAFREQLATQPELADFEIPGWDELAGELFREQQQGQEQPVTDAVKAALARQGLTWEQWGDMREVADSSNALFHTGCVTPAGYADALTKLGMLPPRLQHTTGALRAAIRVLQAMPPRQRRARQ